MLNVEIKQHVQTGGSNVSNLSTVSRKIQPGNYEVFVGLDVDKRSIALTQVDHLGIERAVSMPYDADMLLSYVRNQLGSRRVAFVYEAGPTGFGLHDAVVEAGHACLVVSPASVPTARGKRVKTNRLDSRKLALQLRGGGLEGIRVPTEEYRHLRELVELRKMHIRGAAAHKCRIKALFLRYSIAFPGKTPGGYWSKEVIGRLRNLECQPALRFKIVSLLDSLEFSRQHALKAQVAIREFVEWNQDISESVWYAMSLPGIGWIVGTYAIARIGDWRQMGSSDQTASFLGLVQTENSTGDRTDRGSITKAGDPVLRSLLVEAAWTAIRKDPELAEFYHRVYSNHPKHIAARVAIVAVARKLATRLHCVLKERREYRARMVVQEGV